MSETYANKNVGTAKTLSVASYTVNDGNGGNNYSVSTVDSATGVINAAGLTGSISAANKTYDATTNATIATRTLSGVISGDSVSYIGGTATFADKNAGAGKIVTATGLSLSGADAFNYTVNSTATAAATIAPLAITGQVAVANKVYDATIGATITSRSLTGVLGGDNVSYIDGNATFADVNVGSAKPVTVVGLSLSGTDARNYTVNTTATTTADISPRPLTVTAVAGQTKVYGDADPLAFAYAITSGNLLGGDGLSGTLARVAGENVGNYAITQNTLTGGPNYAIAFASNPFGITPATLTYIATPTVLVQSPSFPTFTGTVAGIQAR